MAAQRPPLIWYDVRIGGSIKLCETRTWCTMCNSQQPFILGLFPTFYMGHSYLTPMFFEICHVKRPQVPQICLRGGLGGRRNNFPVWIGFEHKNHEVRLLIDHLDSHLHAPLCSRPRLLSWCTTWDTPKPRSSHEVSQVTTTQPRSMREHRLPRVQTLETWCIHWRRYVHEPR